MASRDENDVVLEQALLAMMGACVDLNYELEALVKKSQARNLASFPRPGQLPLATPKPSVKPGRAGMQSGSQR